MSILLFIWFKGADDVPAEYRGAFTEQEMQKAAQKWNPLASANPTLPAIPALGANQRVRLAIGSLGTAVEAHDRQLAELITVELNGAAGLEIVERQSFDRVLREQEISLASFTRAKDAIRVGKLLRADWFLFGTSTVARGTNCIVARLVDARTGTLRDVGVFPQTVGVPALAGDLAAFLRDARQRASGAKPLTYLALGTLEDLSLNGQQANFPAQLRGYLASACRGSGVVLLEREQVEALVREVHLDLAGLTEDANGSAQPMQSACWVITGCYQSYEQKGSEVDVALHIDRFLALRSPQRTFHGPPGEALFGQIRQAIDAQMSKSVTIVGGRWNEAKNQMMLGKELLRRGYESLPSVNELEVFSINPRDAHLSGTEAARRRRNLEEALRAFRTVILLQPTNREAQLGVAACLQNPTVGRVDEARDLYRQMLEEPIQDKWVNFAQWALETTFNGEGPWGKAPWFAAAAAKSTNPSAKEYFQRQAEENAEMLKPRDERKVDLIGLEQAKSNLFSSLALPRATSGLVITPSYALECFAREAFGTNDLAAARSLAEMLPELERRFPEKAPALQGKVVCWQSDTNAPIVAEFQQTLNRCIEQGYQDKDFWQEMRYGLLPWSYKHACYRFATAIINHEQQGRLPNVDYNRDERLALALEYYERQQWREALQIFECYSNRPITAETTECPSLGPVLTGAYARACAKRLGISIARDPREFELGKPSLDLGPGGTFAVETSGVWIADQGELRHLDLNLRTDYRISLPIDNEVPVTCMRAGESKVWLGTAGAGLLELDKTSRQVRRFVEADGLLMDSLTQLHLAGDDLWLGFGGKNDGGVGRFTLSSRELRAFVPRMIVGARAELAVDPLDGPPRHPVSGLATLGNGDLLALVSGKGLQRFSAVSNCWETLPNPKGGGIRCLAANSRYLVAAVQIPQVLITVERQVNRGGTNLVERSEQVVTLEELARVQAAVRSGSGPKVGYSSYGLIREKGGLALRTLGDGQWQDFTDANGIPNPPSAMALDGDEAWLGGEGFIACVDLKTTKVRRFCYVPARSIEHLQVAVGYVWARFNQHLYRIPLNAP